VNAFEKKAVASPVPADTAGEVTDARNDPVLWCPSGKAA
jgi:hypothetical protein